MSKQPQKKRVKRERLIQTVPDGCALVPLTRGLVAVIDLEDHAKVTAYNWRALQKSGTFYACRNYLVNGKPMFVYLHRFLLGLPTGRIPEVDHINHDGLDNRRKNIRIASHIENCRNRRPHRDSASGLKGVSWDKSRSKWTAGIYINGKRIALGRFLTKQEAALAFNAAAKQHHGEFAWLNPIAL